GDAKAVFDRDRRVEGQPRELWPWLMALAALLFVFDVAARRLRLGWMDAERAWAYLLDNWLGRARLAAAPAAARLLAAKGRISIEGGGLAAGRRGAAARNGPAAAGAAAAASSRTGGWSGGWPGQGGRAWAPGRTRRSGAGSLRSGRTPPRCRHPADRGPPPTRAARRARPLRRPISSSRSAGGRAA